MNFNSNTGGVLCQKVSHSFVPSAVLNKSSVITGADYRNNDQIVRLEETNKVQTNAIHQEEQNRKLVEMMSYLEQTFRGVILQLCRLLVLVHKTDPGASIPSDALGLMEWTHQMIEDKQLDVEPSSYLFILLKLARPEGTEDGILLNTSKQNHKQNHKYIREPGAVKEDIDYNQIQDDDRFPFHLNDTTDPVEVYVYLSHFSQKHSDILTLSGFQL